MVPTPADRLFDALGRLPAAERLLGALDGLTGVHLVGGAVRDLLLGREPHELDLLAEADGPGLAATLATRLGGERRVHSTFGTATVVLPDGAQVDVATARAEDYERPGALPAVRAAASIDEDLRRRDFTVNAIAVGLSADVHGQVTAFPGALEDLEAGRLRVLHDASFTDDATRLIRLARYGTRLHFVLQPRTEQLARAALAEDAAATVGASRWTRELRLLLAEPNGIAGLALLADLAEDEGRIPGPPGGLRVDTQVLDATLRLLPPDGSREHALLAALAAGVQGRELAAWLEEAHVERPGVVADAARDPVGLAREMQTAGAPSEFARLLRGRPAEAVALAGAYGARDPARRWLEDLRHETLDISGDDLLACGVEAGPDLGRRLAAALDAKLDGVAPTAEEQLRHALQDDGS